MSDSAETSAPAEATDTTAPVGVEPKKVEDLPQWAQEQIRSLRDEAAGYRVRAREAAEQAKKELGETHSSALAELNKQIEDSKYETETAKRESLKLRAVLEAGVPGDRAVNIAERVRGESEEEIRGDAARMMELLGTQTSPKAVDPTQGRGTDDALPLNGDPLTQAILRKLG